MKEFDCDDCSNWRHEELRQRLGPRVWQRRKEIIQRRYGRETRQGHQTGQEESQTQSGELIHKGDGSQKQ